MLVALSGDTVDFIHLKIALNLMIFTPRNDCMEAKNPLRTLEWSSDLKIGKNGRDFFISHEPLKIYLLAEEISIK